MSHRIAFLFPGQGAYLPGAFAKLADQDPAVDEVLRVIDNYSIQYWGERVSPLLLDLDAPRAVELLDRRSQVLNLAILATSTILSRLLQRLGVRPDVVMGHSFGEYAASVVAGVMSLEDTAHGVCERDRVLLHFPPKPGGLLAVELGARRASGLLSAIDDWNLALAVFNGPTQTVVSGTHEGLERLAAVAEAMDVSVVRLKAPYPYHNPLLHEAAQAFVRSVPEPAAQSPRCRMYSPILGRYVSTDADVHELNARQLIDPVRFHDALQVLHADGIELFVECGARDALSKLVRAGLPAGITTVTPLSARGGLEEIRTALSGRVTPDAPVAELPRHHVPELPPPPISTPPRPRTPIAPQRSFSSPEVQTPGGQSVEGIVADLRARYATSLDYPEKYLTEDADLEADLGVDSLKQTELLRQVMDHYRAGEAPQNVRISDFPTIRSVAEYVHGLTPAGAEQ